MARRFDGRSLARSTNPGRASSSACSTRRAVLSARSTVVAPVAREHRARDRAGRELVFSNLASLPA
nr:MAG: hypothetical protein DIU78_04265 [Pseudomonadota bacterium]